MKISPYMNINRIEFMRAILNGGGEALLNLLAEKGIPVNCVECYSMCDLCHRISK